MIEAFSQPSSIVYGQVVGDEQLADSFRFSYEFLSWGQVVVVRPRYNWDRSLTRWCFIVK